jgi:uncharacterized membrane protein YbhN (UPF0104 family)
MLNKLLLSLYAYYRKRNESFAASFHSKALLSFFLLMLLSISALLISGNRKESYVSSSTLKIILIGVILLIIGIINFLTDSNELLESKREQAEATYRTYFFILFYSLIPILIYVIVSVRS